MDLEVTGDSTFTGQFSLAACQGDALFEHEGLQLSVTGQGEINEGRAWDESYMLHPYDEEALLEFPLYYVRFLVGAGQPEDLGSLLGCTPLDGWARWSMSGYLGDAARVYHRRVPTTWDETPGATYVLEADGGYESDGRQLLCQEDTVHVADIWMEAHGPADQ